MVVFIFNNTSRVAGGTLIAPSMLSIRFHDVTYRSVIRLRTPWLHKQRWSRLVSHHCLIVEGLSQAEMNYVDTWQNTTVNRLCNAMKNHALHQRTGARAVPLSLAWQVCSATWQLSISMINAVVLGLPFTKLLSVLSFYFKVKWIRRRRGATHTSLKETIASAFSLVRKGLWCGDMNCVF